MDWGANTNFQKVFDRILEIAVGGNLREDRMIQRVFVFSVMEFDQASENPWETDYEAITRKFGESGLWIPERDGDLCFGTSEARAPLRW